MGISMICFLPSAETDQKGNHLIVALFAQFQFFLFLIWRGSGGRRRRDGGSHLWLYESILDNRLTNSGNWVIDCQTTAIQNVGESVCWNSARKFPKSIRPFLRLRVAIFFRENLQRSQRLFHSLASLSVLCNPAQQAQSPTSQSLTLEISISH